MQTTTLRPHHGAVARSRVRLATLAMVGVLLAPAVAHAASVTLAWDASPSSVAGYVVYYGTASGVYIGSHDAGNQTTTVVSGLTGGVRYYFVVKAYTVSATAGIFSVPSNEVNGLLPSSPLFTDDPLMPGVHTMRAVHIIELRTRINALRVTNGLLPVSWTDALSGPTTIKAIHLTEMRSALNAVYVRRSRPLPTYTTDPTLAAGSTVIKAAHIMELRAAVVALG